MSQEFTDRVAQYFSNLPGWTGAKVTAARRLAGGISRETWLVSITAGNKESRDIVLRMDPTTTLLSSNRDVEFALLRAVANASEITVPEAICNEPDSAHLGSSFMALAAVPGTADIAQIVQPPYAAVGREIAEAHFRVLGHIARFDYREHQIHQLLQETTVHTAALDAVTYWENQWRTHSLGPAPITEAALRYLKRNAPVAQRVSVVHGDYRLGNCLYLPDGTLSAVLDWEMAHLGDPLEDIAWALMPAWRPSQGDPDLVAGHITEDEAIRCWESASQMTVDRAALRWWRLCVMLKGVAIFCTGGFNFVKANGGDLIYPISAWSSIDSLESQMLHWMGVTP